MYSRTVYTIDELPLSEKDRKTTDVFCCFLGILVPLTMLVLAFGNLNTANFQLSLKPIDSTSHPCPSQYPHLYFANPDDISQRVCVAACPASNTEQVACQSDGQCANYNAYETTLSETVMGSFCTPTSPYLQSKLRSSRTFGATWSLLDNMQIIKESLLISACLGCLWLVITQACTVWALWIATFGSLVVLLFNLLLFFADQSSSWALHLDVKYYTAIVLLFALVFYSITVCAYRKNLTLSGILLSQSAKFLSDSTGAFLLILAFVVFTILYVALNILVYWSIATSQLGSDTNPGAVWPLRQGSKVLEVVHLVLFLWGLQCLRDSFNYLVSGNAVEWYFTHRSTRYSIILRRFFRRNFGSVAAGSFHNIFFAPFAMLADCTTCQPGGCCGLCSQCWNTMFGCCNGLFGLSRTDAYAYINLAGIPYCNAARNCECLCSQSRIIYGRQSPLRYYRVYSHIFLVGLTTLISILMMKHRTNDVSVWGILLIAFLSFCVVGYFTNIHTDGAEGLAVCFLSQYEIENESYDQMSRCPASLKHPIVLFHKELTGGSFA